MAAMYRATTRFDRTLVMCKPEMLISGQAQLRSASGTHEKHNACLTSRASALLIAENRGVWFNINFITTASYCGQHMTHMAIYHQGHRQRLSKKNAATIKHAMITSICSQKSCRSLIIFSSNLATFAAPVGQSLDTSSSTTVFPIPAIIEHVVSTKAANMKNMHTKNKHKTRSPSLLVSGRPPMLA